MFQRNEIIEKSVVMVNEVRDFRLLDDKNAAICEELDLCITKHIENFRLIGETALFFGGTSGVDCLLNAVFEAGGDFGTAHLMLEGIPE